jgi:hypothetical protein
MKNYVSYQVTSNFDRSYDYGIKIEPRIKQILSFLHKGEKLTANQFIQQNDLGNLGSKSKKALTYRTFAVARKIGIIKSIKTDDSDSFKEFSNLESVAYFRSQLRHSRRKNVKPSGAGSTQRSYLYWLWDFHNWLKGKEFEYNSFIPVSESQYNLKKEKINLNGADHLLSLYKKSHNSQADFIKMIKQYLLSPKHDNKKASTIQIAYYAIIGYFDRNESPIPFKFDFKARYDTNDETSDAQTLSLEDLFKMLTVGKPTITQKAVILCKFHRGLDTSTFVDRFNFQAWQQIVDWFETDNYERWNLSKCPVPIKLTRIKTDYSHTGFLDRDAIISLQEYLRYRFEKTGSKIGDGDAIFLTERNKPIPDHWIRMKFFDLTRRAGIQKKLDGYTATPRYEKDSHELRDLLKSTLIECGTRYDVAEHSIGHKPRDSYEKQSILYSETNRLEFMKASHKLNIFTNFSNSFKESSNIQKLQNENNSLKIQMEKLNQKEQKRTEIEMTQEKLRNELYEKDQKIDTLAVLVTEMKEDLEKVKKRQEITGKLIIE